MADPPVVPQVSPPLSRVDLLVGALLVLAAAGLADRSRMVDPDLFMNLFSARDIFTAGGLPGVDTHSFARDALPWTDYEWLARIIQLSVYEARGGPGLVLLRASQAGIAAAGLFLAARRGGASTAAAAVALLVCWPAVAHFMLLRARAFSFVMLVLVIVAVVEHRRGSRFAAWALVPLMLVWVNMHGAWLLGLGVGVLALVDAVQPWSRARQGRGRLAVALALAVGTTFVHPAGGGLLEAVLRTVTGTAGQSISEWQPLWEHPLRSTITYVALIPLACAVGIWRLTRRDLLWSLLCFGMVYETVMHVRFGALLGLCLVVPLAAALDTGLRRLPRRGALVAAAALPGLVAVVTLGVSGHRDLHMRMAPYWTPVAAVRFMEANGVAGRVMGEFDWGSYLIWEIPDVQVFIDGRWDTVYPPQVDEEWVTFSRFQTGWAGVLANSGATAVLLRRERGADPHITALPGWHAVYSDDVSDLYLRECPANAPFGRRLTHGEVVVPPPVTDADLILR